MSTPTTRPFAGLFYDKGAAVFNVKHPDFGAKGDGVADDRAAFAAMEAAGEHGFVPAGTYLISTNLTLSKAWTFAKGAKLKPASGVTVTLALTPDAGRYQIFDTSAGGTIAFSTGVRAYPEWWGVTIGQDNYTALQAAIDAIITVGGTVDLDAVTYRTSQELAISHASAKAPKIIGKLHAYTTDVSVILATSTMRSIIRNAVGFAYIEGVKLNANQLADYGVLRDSDARSTYRRVLVMNPKLDGFHALATRTVGGAANNNSSIFDECWATDCGTLYASSGIVGQYNIRKSTVAGTVSCTSGSQTVTGSGTDFTALGIRAGDILRIGSDAATAQWLQIQSVDSATQLTVGIRRLPTATLSGQEWAIGVGDGYHEERHSDNNICKVYGGLWRNCAGSGLVFEGLYGPVVVAPQIDGAGAYGIVMGKADNAAQVHTFSVVHPYMEGNKAASFLLAFCYGTIDSPLFGDTAKYHLGLASQVNVTLRTSDTDADGKKYVLRVLGSGVSDISATTSNDLVNTGKFTSTPGNAQTLTASSTINPNAKHVLINAASAITLTSTPHITAGVNGQELYLHNNGGFAITLQNETALAGSGVRLTAASITLGPRDTVKFVYLVTFNTWKQVSSVVDVV